MRFVTFFTLLCIVLTFQLLPAQALDTLWTKTFGGTDSEWGYAVQQTSDGGYIVVGHTNSYGAGGYDVWLIKTDSSGDTLWTKIYGGSDSDVGYAVQQTSDGGYIITGVTRSYGAGDYDTYLIKINSSGDTIWTKTYGGSDSDRGLSIQQTSDGGYIITGYTFSFGAGVADVWLIKTDSSGDTLWTKTYGGSDNDYGLSVWQTSDGGYVITGYTYSFGGGGADVWLIKTDTSGDTLWTKTFGGSSWDAGRFVQQTIDGGYIITGNTYSFGAGEHDLWLIKTNSSGDTLWTKTYGGSDNDQGYSVQQTTDEGYIVTGNTYSFGAGEHDLWLIKTDSSGDTLWTKTYGGSDNDQGYSVRQTTDDGYIITGGTYSFAAGVNDIWLIKTVPDPSNIDIENQNIIPTDYALKQNYPNPFNPSTTIEFNLPKTSEVTLKIFNILGEKVAMLVSDRLSTGSYTYEWSRTGGISSGVYLYRLRAGDYVETRKMVLMR